MPDKKLVVYIEKHLRKGISSDKIKAKLLDAGHKRDNIEQAFSHVHKRSNTAKVIVTIAILFILVAIIFMVKIPQKKVGEEAIEPEIGSLSDRQDIKDIRKGETAIKEKNLALCDEITDPFRKKMCREYIIIEIAISEKDVSLCDEFDELPLKERCKQLVEGK